MGIPIGSELTFEGDGETTVTVTGERQVTLDGTPARSRPPPSEVKGLDYNVQPSPHWRYEGRLLQEMYNESYPRQ